MSSSSVSIPARLVVRNGWVTVGDLAEFIGMDRSNTLKAVKKAGIVPELSPSQEARGQEVSIISKADAQHFLAVRAGKLDGGGRIEYLDMAGQEVK